MRNLKFSGNLYGTFVYLEQVSKRKAEKLWSEGRTIYMQSSNFHPLGVWSQAHEIQKTEENNPEDFEKIVNAFTYYNCITSQTGKYATFYINTAR